MPKPETKTSAPVAAAVAIPILQNQPANPNPVPIAGALPEMVDASAGSSNQSAQLSAMPTPPAEPATQRPVRFSDEVRMMPIEKLKPHPRNATIYDEAADADEAFISDVEKTGIYQALLVTKDGEIISGHRRYAAALKIGMKLVPVLLFDSTDQLEIFEALVASNKQRVKSNYEMGREAQVMLEVEKTRAHARMGTSGMKLFSEAEKGTARDKVGEKLRISGVTAQQLVEVTEAVDALKKDGKHEDASKLKTRLNQSVAGAHAESRERGLIKPKRTKAGNAKAPRAPKAGKAPDAKAPTVSQYEAAFKAADSVQTFTVKYPVEMLNKQQRRDLKKPLTAIINWEKHL